MDGEGSTVALAVIGRVLHLTDGSLKCTLVIAHAQRDRTVTWREARGAQHPAGTSFKGKASTASKPKIPDGLQYYEAIPSRGMIHH